MDYINPRLYLGSGLCQMLVVCEAVIQKYSELFWEIIFPVFDVDEGGIKALFCMVVGQVEWGDSCLVFFFFLVQRMVSHHNHSTPSAFSDLL